MTEGKRAEEALRHASRSAEAASPATPTSEPMSGRPLHVLLVEDIVFNQKVAAILLQKEGHRVTVVNNGREAVAAVQREPFDLVLMDVQMPEMDGLQATALIRQQEQGTGRHVPIVALTAHAMKGDRERCLEAGMDDYVTKPIRTQELWDVIARLTPRPASAVPAAVPTEKGDFDRAGFLARVGGKMATAQHVAAVFLAEWPRLQASLHGALAGGDASALQQAAHSLKGTVGVLEARDAVTLAQRLEDLGRAGDLSAAPSLIAALEEKVRRLQEALVALREEATA